MIAKMRNGGEACTAANRFYVHAAVAEAFAAGLAERMARDARRAGLRPGDALRADGQRGRGGEDRRAGQDAVGRGARVRDRRGAAAARGVLLSADGDRRRCRRTPRSAREEISARSRRSPRSTSEAEVIAAANATEYRAGRLCLHRRPRTGAAGVGAARERHGRAQPRADLRSGGAVRRGQAERPRARGRAPRHHGVRGDEIHRRELVGRAALNFRVKGLGISRPKV